LHEKVLALSDQVREDAFVAWFFDKTLQFLASAAVATLTAAYAIHKTDFRWSFL
jgi:hypothetical protein